MSPVVRWLSVLFVLAALVPGGQAVAQEGPSLSVGPAAQIAGVGGGGFDIEILVGSVTTEDGMGGYTLVLSYDPAVVHAKTVTDGGLMEGGENVFYCAPSGIDNDGGQLAHLCLTLLIIPEPGRQVAEPEVLARVGFEPVGVGTTSLDISQSGLMNPEGDDLAATISNGEVTVQPGDAPAVVATPSDAQPDVADSDSPDADSDAADADSGGGRNVGLYLELAAGAFALVVAAGLVLLWRKLRGGSNS